MKEISIYDLLPLLHKGWVAMDKNGEWWWYSKKPVMDRIDGNFHCRGIEYTVFELKNMVNICKFDGDWKDSLMECGRKKRNRNEKVYVLGT